MSESFSVSSRLTLSTNVETVLNQLIESFERFDEILQGSQGKITAFEEKIGELGGEGGSLGKAFSELKLPQGLLTELNNITETTRTFATESANAARSWREIAEASKNIRNPSAAPGPRASGGGNGRGGGGGGGGGGSGDDGAGGSIFGSAEDRANARYLDADFNARERFQQKLMDDEQKAVLSEIKSREKFEAEREAEERKLLEIERKAVLSQIDMREKAEAANLREIAQQNKSAMRPGDVYGPLPYDEAIQGRKGERADAEAENGWMVADERARAAVARKKAQLDKEHQNTIGHHDLATGAMGYQMVGEAGMNFFEKAIMADFGLEHEFARITGNTNIAKDPDLVKRIRENVQSVARATPGLTQVEVAEIFQDLQTAFGDSKEALDELPTFSKLVNTLQLGDMHHGGSGDMHQGLALARFIEDQGGAVDPATEKYNRERFDEIAQRAVSIAFGTNFKMNPSDMLAVQKTARTAGMMMNDHALYEELPYFAQGMNPSKLGTALFSNFQVLLANRATPKTEDTLAYYGMYGGMKRDKKGRMVWDQDTLKEKDMLAHDPFRWVHDILAPNIAKKEGVDQATKEGVEKVILALTEGAQRATIAGFYGDAYRNYNVAQKEGRNISAQDKEMQQHLQEQDPMAQLAVFRASENEFMVALGDLLKGPAVAALKDLIVQLNGLTDWIGHNKESAKLLAEVVVGLTLFSQVFGTLAMGLVFAKPMIGVLSYIGTGLSTLARALIPFEAGGAAAAGIEGLTAASSKLAAATLVGGLLPAGAAAVGIGTVSGASYLAGSWMRDNLPENVTGAKAAQESLLYRQQHAGLPLWSRPLSSTTADSLVSQQGNAGPKGTTADPLVVHVQNQTTGQDIARGVTSYQSDKMNRAPTGYTGSDIRLDPQAAFYGMITSPN